MSDLHRDHPEASERQIEMLAAKAVMSGPKHGPRVDRTCRDCGQPFTVPADKADARTKWYTMCVPCLMGEL